MINVAIIGVGNCASSLVQGKYYYLYNPDTNGLINSHIGKYEIKHINFVAAFDIDKRKVGRDLSEAIFSQPNNSVIFNSVPKLNVYVNMGHVLDGVADHMGDVIDVDVESKPADVAQILVEARVDVLINYLPVGSNRASQFYAEEALKAKVAFINAIPEFICSDSNWDTKFREAGVACAGDDIKSQLGATILHRMLAELITDRGCVIENMYQLNIGGNSDFNNMVDNSRLKSKRKSKTMSVLSSFNVDFNPAMVKIGPSEYIPHLGDRKICYININGKQFGNLPFEVELKLSIEDSPNSAGIMFDIIRLVKIAIDKGLGGNIIEVSAYGFKSPLVQISDKIAWERVANFIKSVD